MRSRTPTGLRRLPAAWRVLASEQRVVAVTALVLLLTMVLPWYSKSVTARVGDHLDSQSSGKPALLVFSFVEAAIFLVALGVLVLMFARGERRQFGLPGGDGLIVAIGGAWVTFLVFFRFIDKPSAGVSGAEASASYDLSWGIFFGLLAALALIAAGLRLRSTGAPKRSVVRPSDEPTRYAEAEPRPRARASDDDDEDDRAARRRARQREREEQGLPAWRSPADEAAGRPRPERDRAQTVVDPRPERSAEPTRLTKEPAGRSWRDDERTGGSGGTRPAWMDEGATRRAAADDAPTRPAARDEAPTRATDRDETPTRSAARDQAPTRTAGRDETPTRSAARDGAPTRATDRDETPTRSAARDEAPTRHAGSDPPRRAPVDWSAEEPPSAPGADPRRPAPADAAPTRPAPRAPADDESDDEIPPFLAPRRVPPAPASPPPPMQPGPFDGHAGEDDDDGGSRQFSFD